MNTAVKWVQIRKFFRGAQRIGRLNRAMLAGVAGENQSAVVRLDEFKKIQHLPGADLPGFIHGDDRAVIHFAFRQKLADGRGVAFQFSLRGKNLST